MVPILLKTFGLLDQKSLLSEGCLCGIHFYESHVSLDALFVVCDPLTCLKGRCCLDDSVNDYYQVYNYDGDCGKVREGKKSSEGTKMVHSLISAFRRGSEASMDD